MGETNNLFYLKWNNFSKIVSTQYEMLRDAKSLTDITFVCDGKRIEAHKLVLYACSPFFKNLIEEDLNTKHLVFFFSDVKYEIMKALLEYMYMGEVHIQHDHLKDFIRTAEKLKVRGLDSGAGIEDIIRDDTSKTTNESDKSVAEKKRGTPLEGNAMKRVCAVTEQSPGMIVGAHMQTQQSNVVHTQGNIVSMEDPSAADKICNLLSSKNITDEEIHGIEVEYGETHPNQGMQVGQDFKTEEVWMDDQITSPMSAPPSHHHHDGKSPKGDKGSQKRLSSCMTPTPCHLCSRVYSNVSNLRQHMRLIHNPAPVVCPICKKHFSSNLYLKRHYTSIHGNSGNSSSGEEGTIIKGENPQPTSQSDWQIYEPKSS